MSVIRIAYAEACWRARDHASCKGEMLVNESLDQVSARCDNRVGPARHGQVTKYALFLVMCAALCAFSLDAAAQEVSRFPAKGQVPAGYPAQYAATIAAAEREGKLVIYSTTDVGVASELIDDFQALYPMIEVQYRDMNSNDLHNAYLGDVLTSPATADILWSSAMDLQFSLVSSGHAQAYSSPEVSKLPAWAVWKNLAFATTYEPIVIVYNKRLMTADEIPQTHSDLTRLLTAKHDRFAGRVVTYNIERSGLGLLLAFQDERASPDFWQLIKAIGSTGARFEATTEAILKRVATGDDLIGYNALGSYASLEAKKNPSLGYVYPKDYTLVVTRLMFIGEKATNPNAARLWVDYVLSRRGQTVLANRANLFSLRSDVEGENTAAALAKALGESLKAIPVGPDLVASLPDQSKRAQFLRQWEDAVALKK
jgi:iron(III) transport system substrate-binding protein